MELQPVAPSFAFTVKLWNYCEDRHVERRERPFCGGCVDNQGVVPGMWMMDAGTYNREMFSTGNMEIKLPFSESVRTCPPCHGRGRLRCCSCHGSGRVCHTVTHHDGADFHTSTEMRTCSSCHGRGYKTCRRCNGHGQLLFWQAVVVEWLMPQTTKAVQQSDDGEGCCSFIHERCHTTIGCCQACPKAFSVKAMVRSRLTCPNRCLCP